MFEFCKTNRMFEFCKTNYMFSKKLYIVCSNYYYNKTTLHTEVSSVQHYICSYSDQIHRNNEDNQVFENIVRNLDTVREKGE